MSTSSASARQPACRELLEVGLGVALLGLSRLPLASQRRPDRATLKRDRMEAASVGPTDRPSLGALDATPELRHRSPGVLPLITAGPFTAAEGSCSRLGATSSGRHRRLPRRGAPPSALRHEPGWRGSLFPRTARWIHATASDTVWSSKSRAGWQTQGIAWPRR